VPEAHARPLAVIDIDGVVADVRHRLRFLDRRPKDWDAFFAAAAQDLPLETGVARVQALAQGHDVVWLTGRPERLRKATMAWLGSHGLPSGPLHMRGNRDRRPARTFKLGQVRTLAAGRIVAVVLDDDPAVVAAMKAGGIPAELADWVPREQELDVAQEQQGRT
jgi:hypothetical protein